jgi:SlyX protein
VLGMSAELAERVEDLEVKLAFQDKLIRELDALVRTFGDRLDASERELKKLEEALRSPEPTLGPANEPPPHY